MTVLSCRNIAKSFGGVHALKDISIEIGTDEIVGVIGPNGSGKTTLFNVLSGELKPTSGTVALAGRRIDGMAPYSIAQLGVVRTYQSASVFPHLTVLESMRFAREVARNSAASIDEVARLTGLDLALQSECSALAYGHQKLLGVALGLLTGPRILLLDEPAAGLNAAEVRRFLKLIRDLRSGLGIGVGIIDHDMSLVMPACDRISVLNFGTLVATGTPAEIQANQEVLDIYLSGDLRGDAAH